MIIIYFDEIVLFEVRPWLYQIIIFEDENHYFIYFVTVWTKKIPATTQAPVRELQQGRCHDQEAT